MRHRSRQTSGEPDGELSRPISVFAWVVGLMELTAIEILQIVHQSLRKKVASLDDDNWMFEPEKDARF